MRFRRLLAAASLALIFSMRAVTAAPAVPEARHQILVCASQTASPAIAAAADEVAKDAAQIPVLKALLNTQGAQPAVRQSSEELLKPGHYDRAAYNHLVVVGLRGQDALLQRVDDHYVNLDETKKALYAQGWGYLNGDLGTIRSDRNPFLHSRRIKAAPFETVLIEITGTSEAGVLAAVHAFEKGTLNGIVPAGAFTRPQTTVLDVDPIVTEPPLALPATVDLPTRSGASAAAPLVGWTQVPGNEYRAYIDVAGYEPKAAWRAKYLEPGAFDTADMRTWMDGLHSMAYGDSVNLVQFASADQAVATAAAIGAKGGWQPTHALGLAAWQTNQPTDEQMPQSLGKLFVFSVGPVLVESSLPEAATKQVVLAVAAER